MFLLNILLSVATLKNLLADWGTDQWLRFIVKLLSTELDCTANLREEIKAVIVEEVKQYAVYMKECIKYIGKEHVVAN